LEIWVISEKYWKSCLVFAFLIWFAGLKWLKTQGFGFWLWNELSWLSLENVGLRLVFWLLFHQFWALFLCYSTAAWLLISPLLFPFIFQVCFNTLEHVRCEKCSPVVDSEWVDYWRTIHVCFVQINLIAWINFAFSYDQAMYVKAMYDGCYYESIWVLHLSLVFRFDDMS